MDIKSSYLTQEQIDKILEEAQDKISQDIIENAAEEVKLASRWALESSVKADVTEWYKAEVSPEIKTALGSHKEAIVSTAISFADDLALELAKGYAAHIAEVMTDSWKRKKVFQALFE